MEIEVPDIDYRRAALRPEQRETLGERALNAEELAERILIGGPPHSRTHR